MITTDLGTVTAYAEAVAQGYTGTKEEFGKLLANYAKTAEKVAEDKAAAEQAMESAKESADRASTSEQNAKASEDAVVQKLADVKTEVDAAVEAGKKSKTDLDKSIADSTKAKTALDESIKSANGSKSALDKTVEQANVLDESLGSNIVDGTQLNKDITASGNKAVADINSASEKALEDINTTGTAKLDAVNKAVEAIVADREQIAKNKTDITSLNENKISYRVAGKIAVLPDETKIACTAITINTTELSFTQLGEKKQLTATVIPPDTTDSISWETSNNNAVTVTNTGLVKAVGYGTAEITVTCGTQTAICHVNVKQTETEVVSDKVVIPDMHNTGIENNVVLQEVTPATISGTTRLQMTQQAADNFCDSDGVISNYHFNGIYVDFNKTLTQTVTFRNCKFTGDGNIAYAVAVSAYGIDKGINFENCEFSHYKSAVSSGTWKATFDKCYTHDMMQDAFKINRSDIYIKNGYAHSLGIGTTSHADGVQIENNTAEVTVHIYNCRFDQPYTSGNTENAAIFAKCKDANIILDVQKCYATGGNYTIYALNS